MRVLLFTAPLTQLNSPYPATAYLKGFLVSEGHDVTQADLGIELFNRLFTNQWLLKIFNHVNPNGYNSASVKQILDSKNEYLDSIEAVIKFLQGKDPTLATRICNTDWLPQGERFKNIADINWAFGTIGNTELAKHIATLYIEDIIDFIKETINPHFELSRYGERLCLRLPEIDPLLKIVQNKKTLIDELLLSIAEEKICSFSPEMVCFSIPFPGNLLSTFYTSSFIRQNYPHITVTWGGGYVNTELRQLSDARVFDFAHYIMLDEGEPALRALIKHLTGESTKDKLYKTFYKGDDNKVKFIEGDKKQNIPFNQIPAPDYSDLPLDKYISLIEIANPMHKLWSDGRWNKLTLAHGCYWAKCAFCDTSLPYIACFDALDAKTICDYIEKIMSQTGSSGFHFTDEAAPPRLLRQLSEELIKRRITISWWTNIRFEKSFNHELCNLMSRAGCIAVSGGLEVASDRLLKILNKGVSIEQAFETTRNLSENGIMVHAYLMYGFPKQTQKETLDGLEIVRQMFEQGLLHSAFWHRYAMTVHSPSGRFPEKFNAAIIKTKTGSFANNEIFFTDNQNINLERLGNVLRKATYNYMHGLHLDWPVKKWLNV